MPPITVITHVERLKDGKLAVRGTTSDNGEVSGVMINGKPAKLLQPNFAEWELTLDTPLDGKLTAASKDVAGNDEQTPHVQLIEIP